MLTYIHSGLMIVIAIILTTTSLSYASDHDSTLSAFPKASLRYPQEVGSTRTGIGRRPVIHQDGLNINSGNTNSIPLVTCRGNMNGSPVTARLAKYPNSEYELKIQGFQPPNLTINCTKTGSARRGFAGSIWACDSWSIIKTPPAVGSSDDVFGLALILRTSDDTPLNCNRDTGFAQEQ